MTATIDTATTIETNDETLMRLDPNIIEIGRNCRTTVELPLAKEFVESVRTQGVLLAVTAIELADGTISLRDGQRRVLAAREAALASIPVLVRPDRAADDKTREFERISHQVVANDQREDLTAGDRAAAVADMLELGFSVTKVAKAVSMPREQVKANGVIGKSDKARAAFEAGQLDMDKAAILAEFDAAGDSDAVEELLSNGRWNFRFTAERLRNDRAEKAARADAAQPYAVMGYTILTEEPDYARDLLLADLVHTEGGEVTEADTENDPTKWAVWLTQAEHYVDTASGEEIDAESVDWGTEDDDEATPAEGYRHANTVQVRQVWVPEYVCLDSEGAGVALSPILAAARTVAPAEDGMSGEDAAVAAARRETEEKAQARKERRQVIALNKQAVAATTVRRDFLRTLLTRKTPPKSAAKFVAATLAADPRLLTEHKAGEVVGEILGNSGIATSEALVTMVDKASDNRAQVITLALVLAGLEARMVKDAWRWRPQGSAGYFAFLAENGHTLTEVEEVIARTRTADQVALD
ncbi:ParB N-terminal domain-containing protein (plasmid) [Rhodococcus sp. ZPP]|uniref:ParB/RepB/Spo0J family partition protein n=1 Tax=Rhodococcus sp. ZPP TaxID=2749906 RepID=UPI001AD88369|nr:ParB N-terminal domain-containing protein [Rhodococcus sp. ZPP]QTJ71285.1 ParB N-terminal domain-containing protein [Rhodococcus sp. ZPP]